MTDRGLSHQITRIEIEHDLAFEEEKRQARVRKCGLWEVDETSRYYVTAEESDEIVCCRVPVTRGVFIVGFGRDNVPTGTTRQGRKFVVRNGEVLGFMNTNPYNLPIREI